MWVKHQQVGTTIMIILKNNKNYKILMSSISKLQNIVILYIPYTREQKCGECH
jgi:hypothetical protein